MVRCRSIAEPDRAGESRVRLQRIGALEPANYVLRMVTSCSGHVEEGPQRSIRRRRDGRRHS